jgi:hypothetical protein
MEHHKFASILQVICQVHRLHAREFHLPIRLMGTIIKHCRKWVISWHQNLRAAVTLEKIIFYGKQQRERYESLPRLVLESQATENDMRGLGTRSLYLKQGRMNKKRREVWTCK